MAHTLAAAVHSELLIKKSRFLGCVQPVADRASAQAIVAQLRAAHPGAAHVCWALLAGGQSAAVDDGEPSGTAGRPMLDVLRQTLGEDCVIYVESIPPVRPEAAAEKPGLASDIIRSVNEQLALLAADKGCVYLDLWETLADGEGNLKEVLAAPDGVHFSAGNGYGAWVTYLRNHAKYSADNAWTPGSAYAG